MGEASARVLGEWVPGATVRVSSGVEPAAFGELFDFVERVGSVAVPDPDDGAALLALLRIEEEPEELDEPGISV